MQGPKYFIGDVVMGPTGQKNLLYENLCIPRPRIVYYNHSAGLLGPASLVIKIVFAAKVHHNL